MFIRSFNLRDNTDLIKIINTLIPEDDIEVDEKGI